MNNYIFNGFDIPRGRFGTVESPNTARSLGFKDFHPRKIVQRGVLPILEIPY